MSRSAVVTSEPALTTHAEEASADMADRDSTRPPAFQFYPKDFLSDENVRVMSLQERGAYITLLSVCWIEGSLPSSQEKLSRLVGVSVSAFRKIWPALEVCFRPDGDRLIHPRLQRERDKQTEFLRKQADNGRNGGRPRKLDESQNNPGLSSGLTQIEPRKTSSVFSLQSSSSSAEREARTREPETVQERASAFVEWYTEAHEKHIGVGYIPQARRDYEAALSLCQAFSDQQVRDGALVWLGSDSKWASSGTRTIWKYATEAPNCVLIASKVRA